MHNATYSMAEVTSGSSNAVRQLPSSSVVSMLELNGNGVHHCLDSQVFPALAYIFDEVIYAGKWAGQLPCRQPVQAYCQMSGHSPV